MESNSKTDNSGFGSQSVANSFCSALPGRGLCSWITGAYTQKLLPGVAGESPGQEAGLAVPGMRLVGEGEVQPGLTSSEKRGCTSFESLAQNPVLNWTQNHVKSLEGGYPQLFLVGIFH